MTFIYHALSFRSVNQFIADYGDLRLGGFQGEANLTIPWEGRSSPFNGNAFAHLASELFKDTRDRLIFLIISTKTTLANFEAS